MGLFRRKDKLTNDERFRKEVADRLISSLSKLSRHPTVSFTILTRDFGYVTVELKRRRG